MSVKDVDNGYTNINEYRVRFGPKFAYGFSHAKYYRALGELIAVGIVEEIKPGGHGKQGIYNLMTLKWMDYGKEAVPISGVEARDRGYSKWQSQEYAIE
jgi:hypothetical protein